MHFKLASFSCFKTSPYCLLGLLLVFSLPAFAQNVGIGTNSPFYKLQVESSTDQIMLLKTTGPVKQTFTFFQHADVNVPVGYVGAAEGNMMIGVNGLANPGIMQFITNNTPRMVINKDGQVGIGTNNPGGDRSLHVVNTRASADRVARFETNRAVADIEFVSQNGNAGQVGAYNNWMWINSTSPNGILFHVTGTSKAYINPDGDMGIYAGDLFLHNSTLGIRMNNADAPMITRGWDPFQSGKYAGIGRWGMFMEPSALTFGIPNFVGKRFEFASYEASSNRNTLVTIERDGAMRRPGTGAHDLLPVALGKVKADGTAQGITGNFSSSRINTGQYVIDFTNFSFTDANYIMIANPTRQNNTDVFLQTVEWFNGQAIVFVKNDDGQFADQGFSFVVYKNF